MAHDNDSITDKIASLDRLGLVRARPGFHATCVFFAVTVEEFRIAEEGFFAIMEKYRLSGADMLLAREALAYMYYHTLAQTHGEADLASSEVARKVTWQ